MFLVGLLGWWYGAGWKRQLAGFRDQVIGTAQFFSIGQLIGTLFSPFRQISAGQVKGSVSVVFRAFLDKLISRVIGAIVRSFTILAGLIIIAIQAVISSIRVLLWLVVPALPVLGFVAMVLGLMPR